MSPADGVFDPDALGTPEARDDLEVELRRPSRSAEGASCEASEPVCTLRLWAFLAHLVTPADLLPPCEDGEDEAEGASSSSALASRPWGNPELTAIFEEGNWTGSVLWDAAMYATAFLLRSEEWAAAIAGSACVLELGAGLGLPALACAAALGAPCAVASDRVPAVLGLLRENIARNFSDSKARVLVEAVDWSAAAARGLPARLGVARVDVAICCDCILEKFFGAAEALAEFLCALAEGNGGFRVLLASEIRPACGVWAFLERAAKDFAVDRVHVEGLVHLYALRKRSVPTEGG